jgi:transcriptional regulator with XRE-family HTH domain
MKRHPLVEQLIQARKERGWSQTVLARRLNRGERAISHFEADPGGRNIGVIEEVAAEFGLRLALVPIDAVEELPQPLQEAS